jgi:hypothetical protein
MTIKLNIDSMKFKDLTKSLLDKSIKEKIIFNELLLAEMTTMNRSIWSNPETSDKIKINCLNLSNELTHRIWNLLFELKQGNDKDSAQRLSDNINSYQKDSKELAMQLGATIKSTINRYNRIYEKS